MFDYNLFYDEISVQPNDLFRQKKLVKILDKFEGQKIIIMRPNCHKKQEADLAYYIIGRRWIGHIPVPVEIM